MGIDFYTECFFNSFFNALDSRVAEFNDFFNSLSESFYRSPGDRAAYQNKISHKMKK